MKNLSFTLNYGDGMQYQGHMIKLEIESFKGSDEFITLYEKITSKEEIEFDKSFYDEKDSDSNGNLFES